MEDLTFDNIEETKQENAPKKKITNTELNDDEPEIKMNKKTIDASKIEPIKIPIDDEEDTIQDYKSKFRMIRKNYPYIEAPDEKSSLEVYKKAYERTMKEISSDTTVQNYHAYLILGFFAVEFISKNVMNVDISGFTVDRIKRISRYNRLLLELGEREYATIGSNWPVEARLCIVILVDAVIFYIVNRIVGGNTQMVDLILGTLSGPTKTDGGGGIGDIVKLLGSVMTGVDSSNQSNQPVQAQQKDKPYEMKPPRFTKKN